MKAKLFLLCAAALTLGGCATYTGGTDSSSDTIQGSASTYESADWTRAMPVYRSASPSGDEMGGNRPDIIFYR